MIDSVLKGTGNSRFLKSAVPAGTSWADALAMLQAGTFPIDFNGINTEGFQQVGTPLNKANLLKDATAAQIGLPPSTTPDGMFQALGNTGELHVWRKTVANGTGTYSLGAVQEGLYYIKWANYATSDSSVGTFEYGSEVSVDNDGAITGIKNPSTITIKPWYDDVSKANVFKGKFIKMISQVETSMSSFKIGEIWWIPTDAMITTGLVNGEGNTRHIATSKRQQVIGIPAGTTTTYPVSTNPKAYQEGDDAKAAGYVVGEVVSGTFGFCPSTSSEMYWRYSSNQDSISVSDTGKVSISDDNSSALYANSASASPFNVLRGKYVKCPNIKADLSNMIVYFPSDAVFSLEQASPFRIVVNKYQPVTGYAAIPAGTTIEYLGKLGDKARVQVVSYVGTGTYGEDNPCSITAGFKIKAAIMMYHYASSAGSNFMVSDELSTTYTNSVGFCYSNANDGYGKKSTDGKTLVWYSTESSESQFNDKNTIYYVLCIG